MWLLCKSIKSLVPMNKRRCCVDFSSYDLDAVPYLVGIMPKGLSIFRNGNAMCENYEVSEVFGISRRRN